MADTIPTNNPSEQIRAEQAAAKSHINWEIDRQLEHMIHVYSMQPPGSLSKRIDELDHEWSIERILTITLVCFIFLGTGLALLSPWFLLLTVAAGALMLWLALSKWTPSIPTLRSLGKRSCREIESEKFAMKALRGDFDGIESHADRVDLAERVIAAVRNFQSI